LRVARFERSFRDPVLVIFYLGLPKTCQYAGTNAGTALLAVAAVAASVHAN